MSRGGQCLRRAIRGQIIATDWDEQDEPITVAIQCGRREYAVVESELSEGLLRMEQAEVIVVGDVDLKDPECPSIRVEAYEVVEPAGSRDAVAGDLDETEDDFDTYNGDCLEQGEVEVEAEDIGERYDEGGEDDRDDEDDEDEDGEEPEKHDSEVDDEDDSPVPSRRKRRK